MATAASGPGDRPRDENTAAAPAATIMTDAQRCAQYQPRPLSPCAAIITNPPSPPSDVLDDFSEPQAQSAPAPAPTATQSDPATGVAPSDFDEDAFLKQLEKDMANMMANPGAAGPGAADSHDFHSAVDQGADAFAKQLEESGIPPGDFLKQLLADVMAEEGDSTGTEAGAKPTPPPAPGADAEQPENFSDAIQRTIERMKQSGDRATEAATTDDGLSEDMLAQLLKAVEAGATGAGEDGDLTKMFMGMMEQLSNKEMLYEPMKELDGKFGPWIEKNKSTGTVPVEDMDRYETQARVVKQIVLKFEEPGYSDEDAQCREHVWGLMQEMQAAGSPPEELVSNPLMEELGSAAGGAAAPGVPDCPQQ
ncbi:uncharacterized protein N7482_000531 [Penicillium canariense]|uniref:Peroxin 19 n=1 Tax=Penicillium canariense TaxID=189055 RepID=A0A9W9IBS1_9EURO|nr:uncharacterized protein N7482_000531 [Penicillium canariense]KAJ5174654.1 hypothetical protein N7482_000531 [Penicillium canariense]